MQRRRRSIASWPRRVSIKLIFTSPVTRRPDPCVYPSLPFPANGQDNRVGCSPYVRRLATVPQMTAPWRTALNYYLLSIAPPELCPVVCPDGVLPLSLDDPEVL